MWDPDRRESVRRTFLWVGSGVAAGIILALAVFALARSGDEEETLPTASPVRPTMTAGPSPTATATATATANVNPTPVVIFVTPAPTQRPAGPTPAPTPPPSGPTPSPRAVSDVDCSRPADRQFCLAGNDTIEVVEGRLDSHASSRSPVDEGRVPLIEMTTEIRKSDGTKASKGDEVDRLAVTVKVTNKTGSRTFVFPSQQVAVQLMHDGSEIFDPSTSGELFEMRPGASMTAEFTLPVRGNGTFEWQARTWWWEK